LHIDQNYYSYIKNTPHDAVLEQHNTAPYQTIVEAFLSRQNLAAALDNLVLAENQIA